MVVKLRFRCRLVVLTVSLTSTALFGFLLFKAISSQTSQGGRLQPQVELSPRLLIDCFDRLRLIKQQKLQTRLLRNITRALHFAFIGDSRIRQFFYNFLQILPDYDMEKTIMPEGVLHVDRFSCSDLLHLFVTFQWRPTLLNADLTNVTAILNAWAKNEVVELHSRNTLAPDVFVIGMSVHHMLRINGADYLLYEKKLLQMKPVLEKLGKNSRIVWLSQYPTNDWKWLHLSDIYTEKIARYNSILKNSLQGSGVEIWHNSDALVSEYIRSCVLNAKQDKRSDAAFYFDCLDYIHSGGVALADSITYLVKDICSRRSFSSLVKVQQQH